jgi:hypothetical protein
MFGYGRGLAHSNANTWVGLRVDLLIYFGEPSQAKCLNKKLTIWLWGFRFTLKGMKLRFKKP